MTQFIRICIPKMPIETTNLFITKYINKLGIGYVNKISAYNYPNDIYNKKVFVFISSTNVSARGSKMLESLLAGNVIKIVHEDLWFWKASISK